MNFKKVAIFGVMLIVVATAVLGFLFASFDKDSVGNENATVIPTLNPQTSSSLTTFNSGPVSFEYPESSTINTAPISGGGEAVVVTVNGGTNPTIQTQILPKPDNSIQAMHDIFTAFGFKKSEILMGAGNTIQATMYKGEIEGSGGTIQESAVLFENGDSIYKIELLYGSNTPDPVAEEAYQAVLSTFKL